MPCSMPIVLRVNTGWYCCVFLIFSIANNQWQAARQLEMHVQARIKHWQKQFPDTLIDGDE